jgi:hypothetical protein
MATYSTGLSATWGGVAFTEVYEVGVPLFGSVRKDRSTSGTTQGWTDEVGDVSISCYGTHNVNTQEYGQRKPLAITGGGVSLTFNAVCTGVAATPELNGVTRFTFTAKLLDF